MQQLQAAEAAAPLGQKEPPDSGGGAPDGADAPPKQVALAMDRLGRAGRLIADIRLGADRLLEALFTAAADSAPRRSDRTVQLIVREEAAMRQHFHDLRALGRQLEDSGVLSGSLKSRGNSWGLHMPLVCPDGAVVAYAWKRQLAGQAGASAVDRTRPALKAFTDQKRRFFPHLDDELAGHPHDGDSKKLRSSGGLIMNYADLAEERSLSDVLKHLEHEVPNAKIFTYQRLEWLRRASSLPSIQESSVDPSKEQNLHNSNRIRSSSVSAVAIEQVAVIELLMPSVFRAIVSLHPAGSINPDAVAFFSPNEGGSYIHARGLSVHHVFRHVTEHADKALQYFLTVDAGRALSLLLRWICSYQALFTKTCSKCGRLLAMDKSLALLLPPVHRPYQLIKGQILDLAAAYHIGCSSYDV